MLQRRRNELDAALWVAGGDRVMLDDTTRFGLRRMHIIRYGGLPDVDAWMGSLAIPKDRLVSAWAFVHDGTGHLWIVWKEKP